MSYRLVRTFALLGLACSALPAVAQVSPAPALINFQGKLTNAAGIPVPDGNSYTVTVSLWDAPTGGSQKWSQTLSNVSVKSGVFSALLTADTAGLFNGTNLWLQVAVAGDPAMTPRQQIASVPFALKANAVSDSSVTSNQLISDAASLNKVSGGVMTSVSGSIGIGTATPGARLDVLDGGVRLSNTPDNKKWELNYDAVGDYFYIDEYGAARRLAIRNGGNVGIGTTSPASPLTVAGVVQSTSGGFKFPDGSVQTTASGTGQWAASAANIYNTNAGKVGIGTSSPSAPLTVYGAAGFPAVALISSPDPSGTWLQVANTSTGGRGWSMVSTGSGNGELAGNLLWYEHGGGPRMLLTNAGRLGIGTTSPTETLTLNGRLAFNLAQGDQADAGKIDYRSFDGNSLSIVGAGTSGTNRNVRIFDTLSVGYSAPTTGVAAFNGDVGIGTTTPTSDLDVNGEITAKIVTVVGGSDVAEPYHVAEADGVKPIPGMVVVMHPDRLGEMKVARGAYDATVAGIISGANGIAPGITLRQKGTVADGEYPVATVGRVWCWCDADANGPIVKGSLLTTSDTPGYAMRVTDFNRANGSVIGKAMSSLAGGKGLVLVLVSLK